MKNIMYFFRGKRRGAFLRMDELIKKLEKLKKDGEYGDGRQVFIRSVGGAVSMIEEAREFTPKEMITEGFIAEDSESAIILDVYPKGWFEK